MGHARHAGNLQRRVPSESLAGAEQILPVPYETIHTRTMTPMAHILWSAAWSGIAAAAVDRAQVFLRKAARQGKGQMPPGAAHFTKAQSSLRAMTALVRSAIQRYDAALADEHLFSSLDFHAAMNLLKVEASETAARHRDGSDAGLRSLGLPQR